MFFVGFGAARKQILDSEYSLTFKQAGETAVLNCSFYMHSDDIYSVKWYKVNFSLSPPDIFAISNVQFFGWNTKMFPLASGPK